MNLKNFLKQIKFEKNPEDILNHIYDTNPHEPGSARDALTHGVPDPYEFIWSDSIEIPVDVFSNINFEFGLHKSNLNKYIKKIQKGSTPPPIVVRIDENGNFWCMDGAHRVAALKHCGSAFVNAYIGVSHDIYDHLLK